MFRLLLAALIVLVAIPFTWLQNRRQARPPFAAAEMTLAEGIAYTRYAIQDPRPHLVHVVTIDLTAPGIDFVVTPPNGERERDTDAQTTREFVADTGALVAINGGFFDPFWVRTPWDYYPRSGDTVDVLGVSIADGVQYSAERSLALCLMRDRAAIGRAACPAGTSEAVAGNQWLVFDGRNIVRRQGSLAPRTAVALNADGTRLWWIVVDGRQPGYSEGVSLRELAAIAADLGAYQAVNLDGGGSSTLVVSDETGARPLNAPIHARIPMLERPVANNLGVIVAPEAASR